MTMLLHNTGAKPHFKDGAIRARSGKVFVMRSLISLTLAAAMLLLAQATMAKAITNGEIQDRLFEFSLAYELQKKCGSVEPRWFRAMGFRNATYARANELGISDAAMDAYIKDSAAQAQMQARVDRYVRSKGLTVGQESSYCSLASQEIAGGTASGRLIRIK